MMKCYGLAHLFLSSHDLFWLNKSSVSQPGGAVRRFFLFLSEIAKKKSAVSHEPNSYSVVGAAVCLLRDILCRDFFVWTIVQKWLKKTNTVVILSLLLLPNKERIFSVVIDQRKLQRRRREPDAWTC